MLKVRSRNQIEFHSGDAASSMESGDESGLQSWGSDQVRDVHASEPTQYSNGYISFRDFDTDGASVVIQVSSSFLSPTRAAGSLNAS